MELLRFNGSMNFHSEIIDKPHVNLIPTFDKFFDFVTVFWNIELESLFQDVKTTIPKDVTSMLSFTKQPL